MAPEAFPKPYAQGILDEINEFPTCEKDRGIDSGRSTDRPDHRIPIRTWKQSDGRCSDRRINFLRQRRELFLKIQVLLLRCQPSLNVFQ